MSLSPSSDMSSSAYYFGGGATRSRLSSIKGYISQGVRRLPAGSHLVSYATTSTTPPNHQQSPETPPQEERRQGWREWAGEKIRARRSTPDKNVAQENSEVITLFPGWAARRYAKDLTGTDHPTPFEVEVFASGYAISYKTRDNASRSQRAFIRLAKGFAALPKITAETITNISHSTDIPLTKSTEELHASVQLPPRPNEATDTNEVDALDREFRHAKSKVTGHSTTPMSASSSSTSSTYDLLDAQECAGDGAQSVPPTPNSAFPQKRNGASPPQPLHESTEAGAAGAASMTAETLLRLHTNLESRLKPFWSSVLPNRTIRLHLFASPHQASASASAEPLRDQDSEVHQAPLATTEVVTAADGSFQARFVVKWDELCQHPRALHIAFGEPVVEHDLIVVAELLKPQNQVNLGAGGVIYNDYNNPQQISTPSRSPGDEPSCTIHIPITHCPIRVISDIDDTVKQSGVLAGARSVFYNVFVRDLRECIVPGMGDWYTSMWSRGVRFHYVSNGPFEYLSVLNEFMPMSQLPPGSIKLKSYAGRSLFNGLLSTAAGRKRAGVEEILDSFPDSRFFLIGDSGEQDLELYADLARERPDNILGVFIRDVSTIEGVTDPIDDPTGWEAVAVQSAPNDDKVPPTLAPERSNTTGQLDLGVQGQQQLPPSSGRGARRSMSDILVGVGRRSLSLSSFLSREREGSGSFKGLGEDVAPRDNGFFTSTPALNSEPQSIAEEGGNWDADDGVTPTMAFKPVMESVAPIRNTTVNGRPPIRANSISSSSPSRYITEPPKPTLPPSLYHIPADQRSRRKGKPTSSSASSSSEASSARLEKSTTLSSLLVSPTSSGGSGLSAEERRRVELQSRVWRARTIMPGHVVLRVFRHPEECTEEQRILEKEESYP